MTQKDIAAMGADFDDFVRGYLEAALFSTSVEEDFTAEWNKATGDRFAPDCSMQNFGLGVDDISAESIESVRDQCADFITHNRADLDAYVEAMGTWRGSDTNRGSDASYSGWESAGIDFLFSSAGHGAGYFDRGLDALGDRLQAAARVYGDPYFYVVLEDGTPKVYYG